MIQPESFAPIDPEPEPTSNENHSGLYLIPIQEHHEVDDSSAAEIYATKETVVMMAESISALTDLIPDQRHGSAYSRQMTFDTASGSMVRVSKYGFFDTTKHKSPSKKLFDEELKSRVAGLEIHYPISVNAAGQIEREVEHYVLEEDANKEYILKALIYDQQVNSVENAQVSQKDAIKLLALLKILLSNE